MGFRLVDTAGMRRKRKVDSTLEYFSNLRTKGAIESSDAVFLVIDAQDGVTKQDQSLLSILDEGRALAILVNSGIRRRILSEVVRLKVTLT